jgi:uncharacterized membrane protein YphA (DoxX/SURF4 family)
MTSARRLTLALRLVLGATFVYAAWTKLRQPWLVFALSIDAYRLLPDWAVFTVARMLPWTELALGLLLVSGFFRRFAASAAALLLAGFYAAMIYAYVSGAGIDCGCFGVGEAVSPRTLVRDGLLLAAAIALTVCAARGGRPVRASYHESSRRGSAACD